MSLIINQEPVVKNVGLLNIKSLLTAQIQKDLVKSNTAKESARVVLISQRTNSGLLFNIILSNK